MQETSVQFLGREDPLEKDMATHSSILAWRSPWPEEPGRLESIRLQESDMTQQLNQCCCCYVTSVMPHSVRPHRHKPTRLPHPWDSPGKNTGVGCHFLLQCMEVKSESEVASRVQLLEIPWTAAYQAPPSMGFSRQEYWSGLPLPSPNQC